MFGTSISIQFSFLVKLGIGLEVKVDETIAGEFVIFWSGGTVSIKEKIILK